jgi:isocitrate/isopropylmalate dehydrogenase
LKIAVIPGDGIGVDVTAEAVKVLRRTADVFGRAIELETLPWSADHYLKTGVTMPPDGYALLRQFDAVLIGALGDPRVPDNRHARDILLGTRFELDLYVNYRPVQALDDRLCPLKNRKADDVNFVVFRENTRAVRRHRRTVQGRHDRRDRRAAGDEHLQGRASHHQPRVRVRACAPPPEGLHGRQEQRDERRPRAVAARFQGGRGAAS